MRAMALRLLVVFAREPRRQALDKGFADEAGTRLFTAFARGWLEAARRSQARVLVATRGVYELIVGSHAESSVVGLLLTLFASFGMPFVGYGKWKTAKRLGSEGLAAEAKESIACSIDSFLTLLAMIGGVLGAPGWVDPSLSLLMVPWFLREGLAHVRGRVHAHVH